MNRKILPILAAIIAVSLGLYFVASRTPESDDEQLGARILPGLSERLAEARWVAIRSAKSEVKLELADGHWRVASRHGYPVDFTKLSSLLDGLAEARIRERKTAKPENHARLGLANLDDETSEAREVSVKAGDGEPYRLLIGQSGTGRSGTYVRLPDDPQVWLVDRELNASDDAANWLQPTVIDIDAARVAEVTMQEPGGEAISAERGADPKGNFTLAALPQDRKLKYATVVDTLARALTNVRLQDVHPVDAVDWSDGGMAEFRCIDGLVVTVHTSAKGDAHYLHFDAQYEQPAELETAGQAEEKESGTPAEGEDKEGAADPAAEAKSLRDALAPWVFEVTQYTFDQFTKSMDDLTTPVEEEKSASDS